MHYLYLLKTSLKSVYKFTCYFANCHTDVFNILQLAFRFVDWWISLTWIHVHKERNMGVYLRMQPLHFNVKYLEECLKVVLYGTPYSVLASWKVSKFENRAIITCLVTKHTGYLPCDIFDTSFFLVLTFKTGLSSYYSLSLKCPGAVWRDTFLGIHTLLI